MGDCSRRRFSNSSKQISWSELPSKLIEAISKLLKTKSDVVSFRRVCKRWRKHSVSPPRNTLSLAPVLPRAIPASDLPELPFYHYYDNHALVLLISSIYLITPSISQPYKSLPSAKFLKPWMVMVEEPNPGQIRLRHALTGKRVKRYPPAVDMNGFGVLELARGYSFKRSNSVVKVLLCPTSSSASLEAMVLHGHGKMGVLKHVDGDGEDEGRYYQWRGFMTRKGREHWFRYLDDVVSYKPGLYCGVDRRGKLYAINLETMSVGGVLVPDDFCHGDMPSDRRKRLVVDPKFGKLYLVLREHVGEKARFKVCELNERDKRWDAVKDIGSDQVLFVGVYHCFFARAQDFPDPGYNLGNCIVFTAKCFTQYRGSDYPDKLLFGDGDEGVGLYQLGEKEDNFTLISANSGFSSMIWPPPAWFLIKRECDDDDEDEEMETSSSSQSEAMHCSSDTSLSNKNEEGKQIGSSARKTYAENVKKAQKGLSEEQPHLSKADFTDEIRLTPLEPVTREQTKQNHYGSPFTPEFANKDSRTPERNTQEHRKEASSCHNRASGVHGSIVLTEAMMQDPTLLEPSDYIERFLTQRKVLVDGYRIDEVLASFYDQMKAKFGDIFSGSQIKRHNHRQRQLVWVLKIFAFIQSLTTRLVRFVDFQALQNDIAELEELGMRLNWLKKMVDELSEAQRVIKEIPDILTSPIAEPSEDVRSKASRLKEEAQILRTKAEKLEEEANVLSNAGFHTREELLVVREKLVAHLDLDFGARWFREKK